ncbi:precorrin-3B C(17)-methyltransferase [Clostridium cylindrosporum]|uniref:Cobalt-precorrin-3B C(17)-methyltransferase CbiH n=1 Tax=Clostridium cylindrosporum DSM 605 TaxID=1121307 RepID=A0A0J8D7G5_CLOCY|nr:precorrin-3B C(17)-methyltransferase [Clostridium cylindrosporum]KMT21837.1 cobalt-precorrin-3B C(17)-methyltransferase CbiH [Clostridium cylindrosporum DSM 605]
MKVYVVGLGPGGFNEITPRAMAAMEESDVIAGYSVYIDLIKDKFSHKTLLTTPMKREVDRCHMALEEAVKGKTVSMVCSGDAGVYGMAGLIYEVSQQYDPVEIEVISGITAACSGAAILGAPLIHDFAVISLSDLLTPLELIKKRLEAAAMADFVICLYNPSSKKRFDYLMKACDIIVRYRSANTPCGIVRNIGREGEEYKVMTLKELRNTEVDMFTTVFIGNSKTKVISGKMVTPRGYKDV